MFLLSHLRNTLKRQLFILSDEHLILKHLQCIMLVAQIVHGLMFQVFFFLPVVLQLLSAGYNLYCQADGFFRNNFYIYLKIFKLWDFVFVVVVVVFVVGHLSILSHQFCSLLAMDKIGSFWPIKKKKNNFIKWHFKQAIESFVFIMHVTKQIHL